jgi:hypothetical protein
MQRYTKSVVLGQGTYGKVVKAVDNEVRRNVGDYLDYSECDYCDMCIL